MTNKIKLYENNINYKNRNYVIKCEVNCNGCSFNRNCDLGDFVRQLRKESGVKMKEAALFTKILLEN